MGSLWEKGQEKGLKPWRGEALWPWWGMRSMVRGHGRGTSGTWCPTCHLKDWIRGNNPIVSFHLMLSKPPNTHFCGSSLWTFMSSFTVWPISTLWAWLFWTLSQWWMPSSQRWLWSPSVSSWLWQPWRMPGRTSGGTSRTRSSTTHHVPFTAGIWPGHHPVLNVDTQLSVHIHAWWGRCKPWWLTAPTSACDSYLPDVWVCRSVWLCARRVCLCICFTSSAFQHPVGIFALEIGNVWEIIPLLKSLTTICIPITLRKFDEILIWVLRQQRQ